MIHRATASVVEAAAVIEELIALAQEMREADRHGEAQAREWAVQD